MVTVTEEDGLSICLNNPDSESIVRIKKFMAVFVVKDIKMRMLRVPELMKIQGFGSNYILAGSAVHKIKYIGNCIVPRVVKAWAEALAEGILTHLQVGSINGTDRGVIPKGIQLSFRRSLAFN